MALRNERFTGSLDRCFRLPDDLPEHYNKDRLLDVVTRESKDGIFVDDQSLVPFILSGQVYSLKKESSSTWLQLGTTTVDAFPIERLGHPKVSMILLRALSV